MVHAQGLGKCYQLRHSANGNFQYTTLRDVIMAKAAAPWSWVMGRHATASPRENFWALRDVSFTVDQGEVVGIIGRNGAGKSTLLKILSRITEPTRGRVVLNGRVASLLEVGTGFHPELSGRENIYLNGAILGMTRAEIARKFDEIVAFAEVERFLDTPVKHYSSGMYVRLAFGVAAHLEPDVLIVDEVLAVGDAEFQKKSLGKMRDVSRGGRTVLFVSHNLAAVQALCSRAIWVDRGELVRDAAADEVVREYLASGVGDRATAAVDLDVGESLQIAGFAVSPNPVPTGDSIDFSITLRARADVRIDELTLLFYAAMELRVAIVDLRERLPAVIAAGRSWTARGTIKSLPLVDGEYQLGLGIGSNEFYGNKMSLTSLRILPRPPRSGIVPHRAEYRGFVELETELLAE